MIKSLIIRFFSAFSKPETYGEDEKEAIIHRQQNIKLKGSMQERLRATQEWSKAENIVRRVEEQRVQASGVLERGQRMSKEVRKALDLPEEDPPLPDPLPSEFIGQQPSTIRAILRQRGQEIITGFIPQNYNYDPNRMKTK